MKLTNVLEKLEELLRKWGLCLDDWLLIAHYAHRLEGYKVKLKKGHFNIMVNRDRLPWGKALWKKGWKYQISPPINSKWIKDYDQWQKETKFDTDLVPILKKELDRFIGNKKYSFIYELPNGRKIRVITVRGLLKQYEMNFPSPEFIEEELGLEKTMYYLAIIREWRDLAQKKRKKETVKVCNKLLKRYKFLEGKFKTMSKYRKIKKIEGTPAFQGNAQGKVRVILDEAEARQLQKGEILVAKMISAKFAFVLNRAKAIVADQGGMLCHTAMLSREFGIPCVIATRVATKVLKDGDLVKVNANKGIVKILKKAK